MNIKKFIFYVLKKKLKKIKFFIVEEKYVLFL